MNYWREGKADGAASSKTWLAMNIPSFRSFRVEISRMTKPAVYRMPPHGSGPVIFQHLYFLRGEQERQVFAVRSLRVGGRKRLSDQPDLDGMHDRRQREKDAKDDGCGFAGIINID